MREALAVHLQVAADSLLAEVSATLLSVNEMAGRTPRTSSASLSMFSKLSKDKAIYSLKCWGRLRASLNMHQVAHASLKRLPVTCHLTKGCWGVAVYRHCKVSFTLLLLMPGMLLSR